MVKISAADQDTLRLITKREMDHLLSKFDEATQLDDWPLIDKYITNRDFASVYQFLQNADDAGRDSGWHKRVSQQLSAAFAECDGALKHNQTKPTVAILEYFMNWMNEQPSSDFTSTNVFMCIFHANKRVLKTKGLWDYQLQSELIDVIFDVNFPKSESSVNRVRTFRETMYAVTWNFMRENFKTSSTVEKLEMLVMSCRWLISDSTDKASKVAQKFSSTVAGIVVLKNDGNMDALTQKLLIDVCQDYGKALEREAADGSINPKTLASNSTSIYALIEYTFGCLMVALRSNNFSIATMVLDNLNKMTMRHFNSKTISSLDSLTRLVIQLFSDIYCKTSNDLHLKLAQFRTVVLPKLIENQGSEGLIETILRCFFQTMSFIPSWCTEFRCVSMSAEAIVKLVSELLDLVPTSSILRLTTKTKVKVQVSPNTSISYLSYIIRLVASVINQGTYTPKMMKPIQKCMELLSELIPQIGSVRDCPDPNQQVAHSFYILLTALQNVGMYQHSLDICKKCVDTFISLPKEKLSMHPHFYCNIMTQTYLKLEDYSEGLVWLAHWLLKNQATLDEHLGSFDLFSLPSYQDEWGSQWVRVKHEAKSAKIQQITIYELLHEIPQADEIMNAALLLELNSYFTCKYVLSDAIVTVGEHLADVGRNACETGLGLLAQAIGFYWDDDYKNEDICIAACQHVMEILNKSAEATDTIDPQLVIITAIARAWLAFSYSKKLGTIAKLDLEDLQYEEKEKNANKGNEPDDDRIVPGISSLDLNNEHEMATHLISCIDSLYTIISLDEMEIKKWIDICPALILLTARLCAFKISSLSETFASIRAWHVCYVIAKLYDRKYIQLMSGLELLKLAPSAPSPTFATLEELMVFGNKHANHFMPPAFFTRIHLVRAWLALKEKRYTEGITHLSIVLEHRTGKSNVDATHLVMAEAHYVLALYKIAQESNDFKLDGIEPDLAQLTPCALGTQAYKFCVGIVRSPNPDSSGWQDLCFNQHLMHVLFEHLPKLLEIFRESGNIKELQSYGSDLLYLSQSFGFISRTIELLLPLAEADLLARQFETADEKVDAIHKIMTRSEMTVGVHRVEVNQHILDETVKKFGLAKKLVIPSCMPALKINLLRVEPSEAEALKPGLFTDPKSPTIIPRNISLPKYLFHSLSCSCYVCLHPKIIPNTIKFFQILIRVAACGNDSKTALAIIPAVKLHHAKACLRVIFHFERMAQRLTQAFYAKKAGREALLLAYLPFFFEPGFHFLYTMAEFTPVSELGVINNCVKKIQEGHKVANERDEITLLAPTELMYAALYEHYFANDDTNKIQKSDIRDLVRNNHNVDTS